MERVQNIMQRLQELYYGKHQKSAIDIDLMLDYTRVMYADLLEWRKQFKEPPTDEKAEPNPTVVTSEAEKQAVPDTATPEAAPAVSAATPAPPEEETQAAPAANTAAPAQPEEEPEAEAEAGEAGTVEDETAAPEPAVPADKVYKPMQHDDPAPKEPQADDESPVVKTEPEKEYIETLQQDATGISFEPPAAPEAKVEVQEELLLEEPAVRPAIEEIPAPPPAEIPLPDMASVADSKAAAPADLFSAARPPRDIRAVIGINDKYLFLNELFNNHKSNYEETLDKLNHFSTLQQAEDWIDTRVAETHKWDKSDPTVESFYVLLRKHFSER